MLRGLSHKIRGIICENEEQNGYLSRRGSASNVSSKTSGANSMFDINEITDELTATFVYATQRIYNFKLMTLNFLESSIRRSILAVINENILISEKQDQNINYIDSLKKVCKNNDIDLQIYDYYVLPKIEYYLQETIKNHKKDYKRVGIMALFPYEDFVNEPGTFPKPDKGIFIYCGPWGKNHHLYVHKQKSLTVFDILRQIYITIYKNKVSSYYNNNVVDTGIVIYLNKTISQNDYFRDLGRVKHSDKIFLQQLQKAFSLNMLQAEISGDVPGNLSNAPVKLDVFMDDSTTLNLYFGDVYTTADANAFFLNQVENVPFGSNSRGYIPMSIYNSNMDLNQGNNDDAPTINEKSSLQYLVWLAEKGMNGFTRHCRFFPFDKRYRQDSKSLCLLVYCKNKTRQEQDLKLLKTALEIVKKSVGEIPEKQEANYNFVNNFIKEFEEKWYLVRKLVNNNINDKIPDNFPNLDLKGELLMAIPFINEFYNAQANDDQITNIFVQDCAVESIVECIRKIFHWKLQ